VVQQTTLSGAVVCAGVGLHSGERVRMTLRPAAADTGIVFRRIDRLEGENEIRLTPEAVVDTRLGTTIANRWGARVQTVEHLLAAIVGVGLDNVIVDLDGPEIPAMDGSAAPFARVIGRAGLELLAASRQVIRILKPVEIEIDGKFARFEPAGEMEIDVEITFDAAAIGRQRVAFTVEPNRFIADIAPARTFAFLHEVESLQAAGLALGGSLDNCIVLDDGEVVNEDGLRYADEFARHKALDALGDLALAGRVIHGRYLAERPGHALNNAALRALMDDPDAWTLETLSSGESSRPRASARPVAAGLSPVAV